MRTIAMGMLLGGLVLAYTPCARAGDAEDAAAIVDQAIKAHGGADAMKKAHMMVRSGAGTLSATDAMPFTDEWTFSLPDKLRMVDDFNKKVRVTTVLNGDKGWQSAGGMSVELGADRLREVRNEFYVFSLTMLTPLKGDAVKLSTLPETKVNGEPAGGVKAVSKDRPDVKLYFDKKTNLLVQVERKVAEGGAAVEKIDTYSDFKDFDGVKLPTKQVLMLNGRKFIEMSGISYKVQTKIDDSVFAKP